MFRIDGPTAGAGGTFTGGDPSVPTPPTIVTPDWLTMMQEEMAGVVTAGGQALTKGNNGQLLAAIQQLITSASYALASDAETIAGIITTKAVSPHAAMALVNARITALVGGAPGALDTLKELADAIGDDANFAATVTAALSARAMAARKVATSGLATGGGDLTGDRTISVLAATVADYIAGIAADRALTPATLAGAGGTNANGSWAYLPGGALMQWGVTTINSAGRSASTGSITFPIQFPNAVESITGNSETCNTAWASFAVMFPGGPTLQGSAVAVDSANNQQFANANKRVWWKALGR